MTLTFIQFILPMLTGYALFLCVAGCFNPLIRPKRHSARPAWLLGLWIGLATTTVLILMLQVVNPLALDTLKVAIVPTLVLLSLTIVPGFAVYLWYSRQMRNDQTRDRELAQDQNDYMTQEFDYLAVSSEPDFNTALNENEEQLSDAPEERAELNHTVNAEQIVDLSDETHDRAFEREYIRLQTVAERVSSKAELFDEEYNDAYAWAYQQVNNYPVANHDHSRDEPQISEDDLVTNQHDLTREMIFSDTTTGNLTVQVDLETPAPNQNESWTDWLSDIDEFEIAFNESHERATQLLEGSVNFNESSKPEFENETRHNLDADFSALLSHELAVREQEIRNEFEISAKNEKDNLIKEAEHIIAEASKVSAQEQKLRLETEKHLRITRRALSRLESDARNFNSLKADDLIILEQELEDKILVAAKAESALAREVKQREQSEHELIKSKKLTLAARSDARKNTAARAKVLATAQKAIAFARQGVEARAKLEGDLEKANEQIALQKGTISSLIDTLDLEKSRSREEVSYLSKQLMYKEIELEKKSIKTGKLATRLVKKVARARPVDQT